MKIYRRTKLIITVVAMMIASASFGRETNSQEKIQVINQGVGGNSTKNLLERIDRDVLEAHPDLVILMVGTNDMCNSRKMLSDEEYQQNLYSIAEKIKESGSKLIIMSSPTVDDIYLYERHGEENYPDTPTNRLKKAAVTAKEVASSSEVYFFDLQQEFVKHNLPQHNNDLFIRNPMNCGKPDGVHPTELGYEFISASLFHYMKENNLIIEGQKIICFGDSITNGSAMKGAGTAEGDTYPAKLKRMIEKHLEK